MVGSLACAVSQFTGVQPLEDGPWRVQSIKGVEFISHWDDSLGKQPTQAELDIAYAEYIKEKEATDYIEKRRAEYPPIGDQLDAIWKEINYRQIEGEEMTQEVDDILVDILAVKAKYPKPLDIGANVPGG